MITLMSRKEALNNDSKRYFNGKPCPKGHVAERFSSTGGCVECIKEYSTTDSAKQRAAKYRRNNIEKFREYNRKHKAKLKANRPPKPPRHKKPRIKIPRTTEQKAQHAAYMRERLAANPEIARRVNLKANYGISPEEYDLLFHQQHGMCAICGTTDPGNKRSKFFSVDHCHSSGKVRGLLCHHCNMVLGYAKDNPKVLEAAISYLNTFSSQETAVKEAA